MPPIKCQVIQDRSRRGLLPFCPAWLLSILRNTKRANSWRRENLYSILSATPSYLQITHIQRNRLCMTLGVEICLGKTFASGCAPKSLPPSPEWVRDLRQESHCNGKARTFGSWITHFAMIPLGREFQRGMLLAGTSTFGQMKTKIVTSLRPILQ